MVYDRKSIQKLLDQLCQGDYSYRLNFLTCDLSIIESFPHRKTELLNWAVIGYGHIAQKFIRSLKSVEGERLVAIASRSKHKNIKQEGKKVKAYADFEKMLQLSEIDAVYVSTVHPFHYKNVKASLEQGKHVLCEKPLSMNAQQTASLIKLARRKKLFLMEAMWSRFLPAYRKMQTIVEDGTIGDIKLIQANFCFKMDHLDPKSRLLNPKLGGGSVLDVGVYPIALTQDLYGGIPADLSAHFIKSKQNVDLFCNMQLEYNHGGIAQLNSGVMINTDHDAIITGTDGWMKLETFWKSQNMTLGIGGKRTQYHLPIDMDTSFSYQIEECVRCINAGRIESLIMSHQDSLDVAQTMDLVLSKK